MWRGSKPRRGQAQYAEPGLGAASQRVGSAGTIDAMIDARDSLSEQQSGARRARVALGRHRPGRGARDGPDPFHQALG
jgi:hypothetical protein